MKTFLCAAVFLLGFTCVLSAQEKAQLITLRDGMIYGKSAPATPKELSDRFGVPEISVKQNDIQILGYGERHLFVYRDGKLQTLLISDSNPFYDLTEWIRPTNPLDNVTYDLEPGIHEEMMWDDVIKVLNAAGIQYRTTGKHGLNEAAISYRVADIAAKIEFTEYTGGEKAVSGIRLDFLSHDKKE